MEERPGEALGPVRKATRAFGTWLNDLPNLHKAALFTGLVAAASFGAGAGAAVTLRTFSTLPDSVMANRDRIGALDPRVGALERAQAATVVPEVSRVQRLERELARIACLVEAQIEGEPTRIDIIRCGRLAEGGDG